MEPQELVQINFTLAVNGGKLNASVNVPVGETTLVEMMPALHTLTSNAVNATADFVRSQGFEISCKAGCGACCRQLVPLNVFEAEALAEWIRSLPPEQQASIEARFHAALLVLKEKGILQKLDLSTMPHMGTPEAQAFALEYMAAGVPCPFLQDESCGIHPIRPLICREYLVTSPAEFCAAPTAETVRVVPMPVKFSKGLMSLSASYTAEKQGWIPLVFLIAFMKAGVSLNKAVKATGPELLRLVVDQVATEIAAPEVPGVPTALS